MKTLTVSASSFNRKPGYYQDQAKSQPVIVTRNGHEHVVMMDVAEYQRLLQNELKAAPTSPNQTPSTPSSQP